MSRAGSIMLSLLVVLASCANSVTNRPSVGSTHGESVRAPQGRIEAAAIGNATGVITLSERYGKNDFIHIYNKDGSLWYKLSFYDKQASGNKHPDFKPFAFHPDYFLLALKHVGRSESLLEVVVNEETGLKKYVRADDTALKFQTWEEHILKAFAVDFDRKENPMLETPGGKVKSVSFAKGVSFHPVEINGEWLKIRWGNRGGKESSSPDDAGWIRWRKDGIMLIEIYYFA